ncbi:hypothetical protein DIS24_g8805 [Lasiodiplodia hormozganensis]|uniref:Uncharacterized protein n=1 Tax=Lasiodiplodia hormozganensis TaxID=869390 RepID=A0AA39XYK4_9PEZI|nr:hypothetical protein DIS24_g8805 [Lasiodiplodia hormozganensis]
MLLGLHIIIHFSGIQQSFKDTLPATTGSIPQGCAALVIFGVYVNFLGIEEMMGQSLIPRPYRLPQFVLDNPWKLLLSYQRWKDTLQAIVTGPEATPLKYFLDLRQVCVGYAELSDVLGNLRPSANSFNETRHCQKEERVDLLGAEHRRAGRGWKLAEGLLFIQGHSAIEQPEQPTPICPVYH